MKLFSKKTFSERLREARTEHAGMTQEELSKATGINVTQISQFECGNRVPNLANFGKIVLALETNCEYMLQIDEFDQAEQTNE